MTQENPQAVPDYPITFQQFEQIYQTFSESALRHKFFESRARQSSRGEIPGNGFAPAFMRVDGRVYVKPRTLFCLMAKLAA
jgi:hypothetical protein